MAGNRLFEEQLKLLSPRTYNALTHLVIALAGTANSLGKKTWFGRDKGVKAYEELLDKIRHPITAMTLDGIVKPSVSDTEVLDAILTKIREFSLAHPNWQDAYQFADYFFIHEQEHALAIIARIR